MWRIYGWDTEDDGKGNFQGGVIYDVENDSVFESDNLAMMKREFKRAKYGGGLFVAHNTEYDIASVFGTDLSIFNNYVVASSQFKLATIDIRGNTTTFFDTFNHYPKSLADIGELMKFKKMKDPGIDRPWKDRLEYCIRDAKICGLFAARLQEMYIDLGTSLRVSIGGSAMELFQRHYLSIVWKSLSPAALGYFRKSFFGGRTECFRLGAYTKIQNGKLKSIEPEKVFQPYSKVMKELEGKKGGFYYYDVNSLYPTIMRNNKFPNPSTLFFKRNPKPHCLDYEGTSNVTLLSNLEFPLLPKYQGKLIFPNGKWKGSYTNNVLRYFQSQGGKILKIHSTWCGVESDYYLREYVNVIYAWRKEYIKRKDKFGDKICKLLLNALYGKFSQGGEKTFYNHDIERFETIKGLPPVFSNNIWSAIVTSGGHEIMHGHFDDHTFYTDTDSLLTTRKYKTGKNLGDLKLEGQHAVAMILLPKVYYLRGEDEVIRVKGFPKKFYAPDGQVFNPQLEVLKSKEKTTQFSKPNKMRESMLRGLKVNEWTIRSRSIRAEYDKRIILKDGKTEPIFLSD